MRVLLYSFVHYTTSLGQLPRKQTPRLWAVHAGTLPGREGELNAVASEHSAGPWSSGLDDPLVLFRIEVRG